MWCASWRFLQFLRNIILGFILQPSFYFAMMAPYDHSVNSEFPVSRIPPLDILKLGHDFLKANRNIHSMDNLRLNVNSDAKHYFLEYSTSFVILSSIVFLVSALIQVHWSGIRSVWAVLLLLLKDLLGLILFKDDQDDIYFVGFTVGVIWAINLTLNALILILKAVEGLFTFENWRDLYTAVTNVKSISEKKLRREKSVRWEVPLGNDVTIVESLEMNKGSVNRRANWFLDFFYIDIINSIRYLKKNCKYGIGAFLLLDNALSYGSQLADKRRPLTIVTLIDPIVIVGDFETFNGEELYQHQFARIFLLFFDKHKKWVRVMRWCDKVLLEFHVQITSVFLGMSNNTPLYDTVISFSCNEGVPKPVLLIYSTVSFTFELFYRENGKNRFGFIRALKEFYPELSINVILKRLLAKVPTPLWQTLYNGFIGVKYLMEAFPNLCYHVTVEKPDDADCTAFVVLGGQHALPESQVTPPSSRKGSNADRNIRSIKMITVVESSLVCKVSLQPLKSSSYGTPRVVNFEVGFVSPQDV